MSAEKYDKKLICVVCGDKAYGYNFDAITCPSCKVFFRRNAFKVKEFKCFANNNCKIDSISRRYCKRCRLEKCYSLGMRQDYILLSQQMKKQRKSGQSLMTSNYSTSSDDNDSTGSIICSSKRDGSTDTDMGSIIDEDMSEIFDGINWVDEPQTTESDCGEQEECVNETEYSDSCLLLKPPMGRPLSQYNNCLELNVQEVDKLQELLSAMKCLIDDRTGSSTPIQSASVALTYDDVYWVIGLHMERHIIGLTQLCKQLSSFDLIVDNDWIALVKYGCYDLFCMRSLTRYDHYRDVWRFQMSIDNIIDIDMDWVHPNDHQLFRKIICNIYNDWEYDSTILDLLTAIILFNPDHPMLINRNLVKLQQNLYIQLLSQYLLIKCVDKSESQYKYCRLMRGVSDLIRFCQNHRKSIERTDAMKVHQSLVREIFGLTPGFS
ncbi:nuclear hormone receptor HR96-like [Oppia nitens]|uniref:nuclear hormone receptor HR96-like n=1 Tax=Oppia nitens TaxID=1686743 RepID=UPI0023DB35E7|nr:nuclear hormone receptor HR96-like [Oppia nitens]